MQLDVTTLLVVTACNQLAVALALLLIMGRGVSVAARCAQLAVLAQALAWTTVPVSTLGAEHWWLALGVLLLHAGLWLLHRALNGWLGTRGGEMILRVLLVVAPLGYLLTLRFPLLNAVWSNGCLAVALLVVARATLAPMRRSSRRWRGMLCGCLLAVAVLALVRGVVLSVQAGALQSSVDMSHPINVVVALMGNVALLLVTVMVLVAWREEAESKLRRQAMTDGLTGLLNRRGWTERAEGVFANAVRYHLPMTLIMLDLDHFKRINDRHGHEVGDRALRLFARMLRVTRRTGDLVGRLGGEEFCIVLSNTHKSAATGFDQRLRTRLLDASKKELGFELDYSAGVAVLKDGDGTLAGLLARADLALYQAKHNGRGRMELSAGGVGHTVI
ncbi:GGDEF domain-containing protein [Variovorax sp. HJSM1_2]|uniref:GGDEF domain-containing protein n=1 Tax=Variovorax sp. HJSM1_2 TaxID=3366263 RepID=UPI003BEB40CF